MIIIMNSEASRNLPHKMAVNQSPCRDLVNPSTITARNETDHGWFNVWNETGTNTGRPEGGGSRLDKGVITIASQRDLDYHQTADWTKCNDDYTTVLDYMTIQRHVTNH